VPASGALQERDFRTVDPQEISWGREISSRHVTSCRLSLAKLDRDGRVHVSQAPALQTGSVPNTDDSTQTITYFDALENIDCTSLHARWAQLG
jgi:hypothetical protein